MGEQKGDNRSHAQLLKDNRRDFMKAAAVGIGAMALEEFFGPYNGFLDWVSQFGAEGSPVQRAAALEHLLRETIRDPGETNRMVLAGWLKFQVAEFETSQRGYAIATQCIRHFLFGKGKTLDIGKEYYSKITQNGGFPPAVLMTDVVLPRAFPQSGFIENDQTISSMLQQQLLQSDQLSWYDRTSHGSYAFPLKMSVPKGAYEAVKAHERSGIPVSASQTIDLQTRDQDVYFALKFHTITFNGVLTEVRHVKSEEEEDPMDYYMKAESERPADYAHRIHNGYYPHDIAVIDAVKATIKDRYDWTGETVAHKSPPFAATVDGVLRDIGTRLLGEQKYYELYSLLPRPVVHWANTTDLLELDQHKTGALLVAQGAAHEFDITGSFYLRAPMRIPVIPWNTDFAPV